MRSVAKPAVAGRFERGRDEVEMTSEVSRVARWLALSAALMGSVVACSGEVERAAAPKGDRPDVVLITIDTLRPDHLGFYGYPEETAPFLASLARDSAVFTRAFSTSSWTAPATASVFTGLYPNQHGVTTGFFVHRGRARKAQAEGVANISLNRIADGVRTLPELFHDAGYRTFGLAANMNIGAEIGFDRGFDRFERLHRMVPWVDASAEQVHAKLAHWRPLIRREGPNFVYLHFNDAHAPYKQREPWYEKHALRIREPREAAYDSEISYLDRILARSFRDFGWQRNAVVMLLSDHGEEFLEHGRVGHLGTLYRELLQVLLMVHAPSVGVTARRIETNVSLVDVLPTLAELAGLELEQERTVGRSLVPLMIGKRREQLAEEKFDERLLFAHSTTKPGDEGELWAVVRGDWKLVMKDAGAELYDTRSDPGDQRNRLPEHPQLAAELGRQLRRFAQQATWGAGEKVEVEIDEDALESLRELGYVE
jgi:arylsulfatase A-like enzyme